MSHIKEKVRHYLRTDRSLTAGVVLYQSLPGRNLAFANQIARQADSEKARRQLYYEMCKLAGIPEGEKNSILAHRIEAKSKTDVTLSASAESGSVSKGEGGGSPGSEEGSEPKDRFDTMKWNDIRKEAGELPEDFAPQGKKKEQLLQALRNYEAHKEAQKKKAEQPQEKESNSGTNSPSSGSEAARQNSSSS